MYKVIGKDLQPEMVPGYIKPIIRKGFSEIFLTLKEAEEVKNRLDIQYCFDIVKIEKISEDEAYVYLNDLISEYDRLEIKLKDNKIEQSKVREYIGSLK